MFCAFHVLNCLRRGQPVNVVIPCSGDSQSEARNADNDRPNVLVHARIIVAAENFESVSNQSR
jgi:hypothetical protein